jgi:hypothetical protein
MLRRLDLGTPVCRGSAQGRKQDQVTTQFVISFIFITVLEVISKCTWKPSVDYFQS